MGGGSPWWGVGGWVGGQGRGVNWWPGTLSNILEFHFYPKGFLVRIWSALFQRLSAEGLTLGPVKCSFFNNIEVIMDGTCAADQSGVFFRDPQQSLPPHLLYNLYGTANCVCLHPSSYFFFARFFHKGQTINATPKKQVVKLASVNVHLENNKNNITRGSGKQRYLKNREKRCNDFWEEDLPCLW